MKHLSFKTLPTVLAGICLVAIFVGEISMGAPVAKVLSGKNETVQVDSLIALVKERRHSEPLEALKIAADAYRLASDVNYPVGQLKALFELSYLNRNVGRLDSSEFYAKKGMALGQNIQANEPYAKIILHYGSILRAEGKTDSAAVLYQKALDIYTTLGDSVGIAKVYNTFGIVYKNAGLFDSSAYYYLAAIRIFEQLKVYKRLSAPMINLAKVYISMNDLEHAREYLNKSIEIAQKNNNRNHLVIAYTNLGIVAFEEGDYDRALEYYEKALPIAGGIHDYTGMSNLYNNIGNIYSQQKRDNQKAYQYFNKGLALCRKIGYSRGMLVNLMNIGVIYKNWGRYQKALQVNDTCMTLARELKDMEFLKTIYSNTSSIYISIGNTSQALKYQLLYQELNDSLYQVNRARVVAELSLKYEKEKDQARILTLQNLNLKQELQLRDRTKQRNIYLLSGTSLVLLFGFSMLYFRQKNRKDRIIRDQKIVQLEEEKKLFAAKAIVEGQEEERKRIARELHDGLGVILSSARMHFTTLKVKMPENKDLVEKASKLIEQATGDVRRISHNMMPGLLTRYGFYEALLELFEQLEDIEGLQAELKINGKQARLNETTEIMLYRIFQELINNTLKHADASRILLDLTIVENSMVVHYRDDGIGFSVDAKTPDKSMGLTSIESRIRYLGGELKLDSAPDKGVSYKFEIPLG